MHTARQTYPPASRVNAQPTFEDRVRHEEAATCVSKLLDLATPPPWRIERLDLAPTWLGGMLLASQWSARDGDGHRRMSVTLLPEEGRERAVLAIWHAFSARRVHGLPQVATLVTAATQAVSDLFDLGALEAS